MTVLGSGMGLSGCQKSTPENKTHKQISHIAFAEVPLSTKPQDVSKMRFSKSLQVFYQDGSDEKFSLQYHPLMSSGDQIGQGKFAVITDKYEQPIKEADGSIQIDNSPDGNSFISNASGHYLLTHLESLPGAIYKTRLKLKSDLLEATSTATVPMNTINGIIDNCASSVTPWGTHLGGEEDYSLNSIYADRLSPYYQQCNKTSSGFDGSDVSLQHNYFCSYVSAMQKYLHDDSIDENKGYSGNIFSPYDYGYSIEVAINDDGNTEVAKHYVTGKYTPELGLVMPDHKTIYLTDDGNAKGLWKFVSDHPIQAFQKNWMGTLYAARFNQLQANNGGEFSIEWIKLGHGSDESIKAEINKKPTLSDIFELAKPGRDHQCPADFHKIYEDDLVECLKLKPGQQQRAAFLESRKYAAYLGATMELRKEEGITYDPVNNELLLAISKIDKSMLNNYRQLESSNDIRLEKNRCGGVYGLPLDKSFNAKSMHGLVMGRPMKQNSPYAKFYSCAPDTIANPDNIAYIGSGTVLISEDSPYHLNNMSWAYDVSSKKLTRIASLPIGAEVTGVASASILNKGFLFLNQQHPFVDRTINVKKEVVYPELFEKASDNQLKGVVGYINGFPAQFFHE